MGVKPMSMAGNIAVEIELKSLLSYIESLKDGSAEEKIELIIKEIRSTISAAESGWL